MTMVTRRGTLLGARAAMTVGRKARAASPIRLGILFRSESDGSCAMVRA